MRHVKSLIHKKRETTGHQSKAITSSWLVGVGISKGCFITLKVDHHYGTLALNIQLLPACHFMRHKQF
jgi:hypothetical protein